MDTPKQILTADNTEAFAQGPDGNLSDIDRLTAGLKHIDQQTKIKQIVCIVAPEGGVPLVIGTGKDLTQSYALVTTAQEGLRQAVIANVCGFPSNIEVGNG
jgi:hypothetical protein